MVQLEDSTSRPLETMLYPFLYSRACANPIPQKRFSGSKTPITLHSFLNPKLYTSSWWRLQRSLQTNFSKLPVIKIRNLLNRIHALRASRHAWRYSVGTCIHHNLASSRRLLGEVINCVTNPCFHLKILL